MARTAQPRHWLATCVTGFTGSRLNEALMRLDPTVTGLDSALLRCLKTADMLSPATAAIYC